MKGVEDGPHYPDMDVRLKDSRPHRSVVPRCAARDESVYIRYPRRTRMVGRRRARRRLLYIQSIQYTLSDCPLPTV